MKKIIMFIFLSLLIISCGENNNRDINKGNNSNISIEKEQTIKEKISKLENLVNNQKFDEAIPKLKEIYDKDSKDINNILNYMSSLLSKGSITRKEKEYSKKALEVGNKALINFPDNSELYRYIGYAYEIVENYEESFKAYDKSIELNPYNSLAYSGRAHAYKLYGDYEKALVGFEKAYELNDKNDHILLNLAGMYTINGKYDEAIELFDKVIDTSGNIRFKSEASYSIATIISGKNDYLLSLEDLKKAEYYFNKTIEFDSKFELGYLGLSKVKLLIVMKKYNNEEITTKELDNEINEIVKNNDIAISLNPTRSISFLQKGTIMMDLGEDGIGKASFKKAKELIPNDLTLTKLEKEDMLNFIDSYNF